MQRTVEVRWILPGPLPDVVRHWFGQQPTSLSAESREDLYLKLPSHNDLGIKLRQNRIEIKQRTVDQGIQYLTKTVSGRMEAWQKWSFQLSQHDQHWELEDIQGATAEWIAIQKTRQIKSYGVTHRQDVISAPLGMEIEQGCDIEIAQIYALDQPWYSICLEAFGPANATTILQRIAATTMPPDGFEGLTPEYSHSYPSWLAHLMSS